MPHNHSSNDFFFVVGVFSPSGVGEGVQAQEAGLALKPRIVVE